MRNLLFILVVLYSGSFCLKAQNNCSRFYPLNEGATYTYTNFDKKNKLEGTTRYTIASAINDNGATKATMALTFSDKKGKEVYASDYKISCSDGTIQIDYKSLFPNAMMKQYEDMGMEMELDGTDIEIPNELTVGQTLEDANVAIDLSMSGMNMKIKVDMTDRKVEKKESVTTAAGTFDCYVISETNTSQTMGAKQEMRSKLWLAEGVGMVKQELYKKNGNLMSSTQLSEFTQ